MLGWSQGELAAATGGEIAKRSLIRFENGGTSPHPRTLAAIRGALESAGVIFIAENGDGPGVRLRKASEAVGR